MRWIDIIYVDNDTPILDIAWLDDTILSGDVVLSENSGIREDFIEWNDKAPELGNTYRHRMNQSQYTWTYLSKYDGPDGYVDNVGYGVAVRDVERNTLSSITISGSTYRDLGLENWTDWVPVYNPYTFIRNYLYPGQVMVYVDVPEPASSFTNHDLVSAYVGPAAVEKIYLGNEMIWKKQDCSDSGLCGDYPNCHECTCEETYEEGTQELCECEGKYWYNDTCNDEPEESCEGMEQDIADCETRGGTWDYGYCGCDEPGDPCEEYEEGTEDYCNCDGGFWDGEECHPDWNCTDNWEDMGYTSEYDCNCSRYGDCHSCEEYGECGDYPDCYECEPEDPCEEYEEGTQEKCECQGGSWDGENCNFEE